MQTEISKRMGRRFGMYQSIVDRFKDEASLKPNVRRSIEKLKNVGDFSRHKKMS